MMTVFRHPHYRPVIGAVLMALAGALAMAIIWVLFAIRDTQVEGTDERTQTLAAAEAAERAAKAAERGTDVIIDCTQAAGQCFERNQQSTSDLIVRLIDSSIYAAACADRPGYQTDQEIRDCVLRKLDAEPE